MTNDFQPEKQPGLISRIGGWFKRSGKAAEGQLLDPGTDLAASSQRASVFRPWAKRDQAISNLAEGFHTLTDLMSAIKDNLQDQGHRQDELLKYMAHLPQVIQSIPETSRVQGETLKAIHTRIEQQGEQQRMIAEILDKIGDGQAGQRKTVEEVRERMETLTEHDRRIADNLSNVSSAMQSVSKNGQTSAQVLEQMRDNINSRDGQLERILQKQATRFTSMLAVAIFLSIAALVAVAVIGYQLMNRPTGAATSPTVPSNVMNPVAR